MLFEQHVQVVSGINDTRDFFIVTNNVTINCYKIVAAFPDTGFT